MNVEEMIIGFGIGFLIVVFYILFVFRVPKFLFNDKVKRYEEMMK